MEHKCITVETDAEEKRDEVENRDNAQGLARDNASSTSGQHPSHIRHGTVLMNDEVFVTPSLRPMSRNGPLLTTRAARLPDDLWNFKG